jgi:hypothetical protein
VDACGFHGRLCGLRSSGSGHSHHCGALMDRPVIFALEASRAEGEGIAGCLGVGLAEHEEKRFDDGERKLRPLADIRGRDALVVQSL